MKKPVSILGCSAFSISIVFDMLIECSQTDNFKIFKNINENILPDFATCKYDYELFEPDVLPDSNSIVVFGLTSPFNKWSVFQHFKKHAGITECKYCTLVHPSAFISSSALLKSGALVEPCAVVSSQSTIGFGVNVKRGSLIGHHNNIGDFADINPGAVLSGSVNVGKGTIIGSGAVIIEKITIGENCLIGAGSVVTRNIPQGTVAYGNPCKVIKENDKWCI